MIRADPRKERRAPTEDEFLKAAGDYGNERLHRR